MIGREPHHLESELSVFIYIITTHEGDSEPMREGDAVRRIDELSGRNIGRYIVRTAIPSSARDRRRGYRTSAYVAKDPRLVRRGDARGFKVRREVVLPGLETREGRWAFQEARTKAGQRPLDGDSLDAMRQERT